MSPWVHVEWRAAVAMLTDLGLLAVAAVLLGLGGWVIHRRWRRTFETPAWKCRWWVIGQIGAHFHSKRLDEAFAAAGYEERKDILAAWSRRWMKPRFWPWFARPVATPGGSEITRADGTRTYEAPFQ